MATLKWMKQYAPNQEQGRPPLKHQSRHFMAELGEIEAKLKDIDSAEDRGMAELTEQREAELRTLESNYVAERAAVQSRHDASVEELQRQTRESVLAFECDLARFLSRYCGFVEPP
jgi:hypothetical protein